MAPVPPDDDARAEFEGFNLAEFSRRVDQTRAALLSGLETARSSIRVPAARWCFGTRPPMSWQTGYVTSAWLGHCTGIGRSM
ncbi:hypothetical protein JCM18909_772 [Cutibacterium acnes JCM 18909]|nr:hypothetical protein JCM18909_772 [Cutibacterium acnes JCM 18909]